MAREQRRKEAKIYVNHQLDQLSARSNEGYSQCLKEIEARVEEQKERERRRAEQEHSAYKKQLYNTMRGHNSWLKEQRNEEVSLTMQLGKIEGRIEESLERSGKRLDEIRQTAQNANYKVEVNTRKREEYIQKYE